MSGESKEGYEYYKAENNLGYYGVATTGPYYVPEEYHPVGEMPVLCGVCGRYEFKVYCIAGAYSTWCKCDCGNQFEIHSG